MAPPLRLERTLLFVPANNWRMIEKAAASDADAVCLDLEDAVPVEHKAASRAVVARALRELDFGPRLRMFRINGLDTGFAYRDLIEVVEAAGERLDLVMLPKASGAGEVEFVDRLLTQIEQQRPGNTRPPIGIEAQIETARGFVYCREIAAASPRLEALIFGAGDYAASMQMPSSGIGEFDAHDALYPGHRWHAAMHAIVACARAFGLRAMDSPYAAYRDAAGFERSCRIALALGFDGKQCIHPAQLEMARSVFTPTAEAAAHAARVVAAYEEAAAAGRGAVSLDGKMVDAANLRLAQVVARKAELCQHR
ncbi:MAG TPA: CoA ester lyase [Terriglobales bacterium]|nr:CoA ester lyase [Terriglobales bacterium]